MVYISQLHLLLLAEEEELVAEYLLDGLVHVIVRHQRSCELENQQVVAIKDEPCGQLLSTGLKQLEVRRVDQICDAKLYELILPPFRIPEDRDTIGV